MAEPCRAVALGIDGEGHEASAWLIEGVTENATVGQALIENLNERGLDPKVCRLFIVDGARALAKVNRPTVGRHTPIQRCQVHKARNVIDRLPKPLHTSAPKALRKSWSSTMLTRPSACCRISPAGSKRSARCCCEHPRRAGRDADRASVCQRSSTALLPASLNGDRDGRVASFAT